MAKGTVWVIGVSSGLGLATAQAFAADGWQVVSGARSFGAQSDGDPADRGIHPFRLDVTDAASREAFVKSAFAVSPQVDALVYCEK